MAAVDQLLDWAILFEVGYVTLDAVASFAAKKTEETARRIVVVFVLSLLGSSMLEVFYDQLSQEVAAFRGPVLSAAWFVSLLFVFGCSWSLYDSMRDFSGRIQAEQVGIVELVEKRTAETLAPMQEKFDKVEGAAIAARTAVEQWGSKVPGTMDAMRKASESTGKSVKWIYDWIELKQRDMKQIMSRYDERAEAHRNDAATIYLLSSKLESLVDRASILEEEIDGLLSERGVAVEEDVDDDGRGGGADQARGAAEPGKAGTAANGPTVAGRKQLTREDGLANREKGNQALMQFSARLHSMNKKHQASLLHGVPDLVFLDSNGAVKCVGAYKALTLSSLDGATKQRWIPKSKLLAESRMAVKESKTLVLFVENFLNRRIWARAISSEELKSFSGITTPLMLVNDDPESEKACRDSLTSVLQLL